MSTKKVAIITGAASGIGLALSQICLQKELSVVMVDKNYDKLQNEAQNLSDQYPNQIHSFQCDVTKPQEVEQLAQEIEKNIGPISWIFNNAGIIGDLAPVWELKPAQIHQVMEVNLYGMIHMIQAFVPILLKQSCPAHIINMASLYALCSGSQMASYSMSKHAVLALSESLYFDFQRLEKPIHVSVVFPSFTDTSLLSNPQSTTNSTAHHSLNSLLAHSRPAIDVALHIIQEVEQHRFYILPDKEVKGYCEERTHAIVQQTMPHRNNVEKLISSLFNRKKRTSI